MSSEISEKKLLANKMNAKKSTGPKTANGKNRASMNSLKHGLNARKFMLKDENIEEFEEYKKGILKSLNPKDFLLYDIALQIVFCGWNFRRYQFLQSTILNIKNLKKVAFPKQQHIKISWEDPSYMKEKDQNEANLNKKKTGNYEDLNGKSSFNDYNEPTDLDEENDDKIEEGLPNDLWGIGSIFKLSLMEKRSVATFHRLVNSYFDLEEKIRNRKVN